MVIFEDVQHITYCLFGATDIPEFMHYMVDNKGNLYCNASDYPVLMLRDYDVNKHIYYTYSCLGGYLKAGSKMYGWHSYTQPEDITACRVSSAKLFHERKGYFPSALTQAHILAMTKPGMTWVITIEKKERADQTRLLQMYLHDKIRHRLVLKKTDWLIRDPHLPEVDEKTVFYMWKDSKYWYHPLSHKWAPVSHIQTIPDIKW